MKFYKPIKYLVLILMIGVLSSGISNSYVQRRGEQGWVFHVFSQKMNSLPGQKDIPKNIKYDYTFVESSDSISMLSTVVLPVGSKISSIEINSCSAATELMPEIIYVRPKGNSSLECRLKVVMPFNLWRDIYQCSDPFYLEYKVETDKEDRVLKFGYPASKWKSNKGKMLQIIEIVKYNTGKL